MAPCQRFDKNTSYAGLKFWKYVTTNLKDIENNKTFKTMIKRYKYKSVHTFYKYFTCCIVWFVYKILNYKIVFIKHINEFCKRTSSILSLPLVYLYFLEFVVLLHLKLIMMFKFEFNVNECGFCLIICLLLDLEFNVS